MLIFNKNDIMALIFGAIFMFLFVFGREIALMIGLM